MISDSRYGRPLGSLGFHTRNRSVVTIVTLGTPYPTYIISTKFEHPSGQVYSPLLLFRALMKQGEMG